jgi:hypothetical protein
MCMKGEGMDGFRAPSAGDFGSYEGLVGHQGDHLARLGQWSRDV